MPASAMRWPCSGSYCTPVGCRKVQCSIVATRKQLAPALNNRRTDMEAGISNALALLGLVLHARRLQKGAMFDRGHAGSDGRIYPWRTVRMRRHPFPQATRFLGEGTHFCLG